MPLNNEYYHKIFLSIREIMREEKLGAMDDLILSGIDSEQDEFHILITHITNLIHEMYIRSGLTINNILSQTNEFVKTESGEKIDRIRILLSEENRNIYDRKYIDFDPNPTPEID